MRIDEVLTDCRRPSWEPKLGVVFVEVVDEFRVFEVKVGSLDHVELVDLVEHAGESTDGRLKG